MWEIILNIVLVLLSVVLACVTYYLDIKRKLQEKVNGEIANAEDLEKLGEEKMSYVVNQLKGIVPKVARFIFTDKVLETLVQVAFDKMEEYAQKQVSKKSK